MIRRHLSPVLPLMLVLSLLLLSGCAAERTPLVSANVVEALSVADATGYARAFEPIEFEFPRDHGPHPEYRTEWWYYTGNLVAENGDEYGYQLTFFRSALTPSMPERLSTLASNQIYMAHFAVSSAPEERHFSFDRYSRGAGGLAGAQGEPTFGVWLEEWSARASTPGVVTLHAQAEHESGSVTLDLEVRETRPILLHGDRGLHQKGPEAGNASFYYSQVGLETRGTITTPAGSVAVTGKSWMDREFGTSALSQGTLGWDWFSLQLQNGAALMLYVLRTEDNALAPEVEGTLLLADNRVVKLSGRDFTISSTETWRSPVSGATYPSAWTISVPSQDLALAITTPIADQEMDVQFVYWEGMVRAEGTMGGAPVSGRGYVELTGYGQAAGQYQR